jgi:hypothetical protein
MMFPSTVRVICTKKECVSRLKVQDRVGGLDGIQGNTIFRQTGNAGYQVATTIGLSRIHVTCNL